ncbi:MAG: PadR family transcriptional regulator [Candidatus Bathyarchaeota archaeon]|nr:PadR family transcriptional regulator [Candidatus Bathyarchaeum sp.]
MHPGHEEKTATKWLKEAQKGYMRIAFLILLSRKPCHGYEMMKEVEDRTEGFWKPTAGGAYPTLQSLEQEGYIKGEWGPQKRKRKIYHITETGKLILDRALLKQSQIADNMNALFEDYIKTVFELEPKSLPFPRMPNPFSPLLEKEPKSRHEVLEMKRNRIMHGIKMMQDELQTVNTRLAELAKQKQKHEYNSGKVEE